MQKHLVVALAAALSVAGLTAAPSISFADREVVVQPGENMQSISRRYYGDENHVWLITRYNHLASPDLIYAGLTLVLPDSSGNDTAKPAVNDQANGLQATAVSSEFVTAATASTNPAATPPLPVGAPAAPQQPVQQPLPVLAGPASPDSPTAATATASAAPDPPANVAVPGIVIQSGLATWYGPGFVGNITYCGDVYDEGAYTAASNTLPCGTIVVVTNQNTGASVRVRITDRGGFGGSVIMDLSRAAFGAIASNGSGVVPVTISRPAS